MTLIAYVDRFMLLNTFNVKHPHKPLYRCSEWTRTLGT